MLYLTFFPTLFFYLKSKARTLFYMSSVANKNNERSVNDNEFSPYMELYL